MKKFYILGIVSDKAGTPYATPGLVTLAHDAAEAMRHAQAFRAGVEFHESAQAGSLTFEVTDLALVKRRGATYSVELS